MYMQIYGFHGRLSIFPLLYSRVYFCLRSLLSNSADFQRLGQDILCTQDSR